jgi:transposase
LEDDVAGQKSQVEEVVDAEVERVLERVCAIDVAKAFGNVCVRLPGGGQSGRRFSRTWQVPATLGRVEELADKLKDLQIEKVTLESTSDYWRIWFYVLQAQGLDVQLVNAREVKNVPGRPKTDKLDSVWLAKLTERGMLRPSFVPPARIRVLRDYTRMRVDLTRDRTRHWQRLEKLLEDALIKVSSVASTMDTMSVRDMIDALIKGERDAHVLAGLARGRMKVKHTALVEALNGKFDDHHAELARMLVDQIDALTTQIDLLGARIEALIADIPQAQAARHEDDDTGTGTPGEHGPRPLGVVERLAEIPGISVNSAQVIVAELGLDMKVFPTAQHAASWAKLTPATFQSGTKNRSGKTGKGNPYLKGVLGLAAAAAGRTATFLGERYRRIIKRRGKLKALVATARSMITIIWHLLADPHARYQDLGADYHNNRIDHARQKRNAIHKLESLGFTVTLTTAA